MQKLYNETILTPLSVAKNSVYLDWNTQPSQFKSYPAFLYRYHFNEIEALKVAELARCVTQYQTLYGKPYYRLNTPSAGNLHPIELYVQIRGIKGVISGIYHINPEEETLTLISEVEYDGLESAIGMTKRFKGMIFLISIVPFRSEWKYAKRSIRYCYLDAGHQLGALLASVNVYGQKCTVLSDIDRTCMDRWLGFGNDEFSCLAITMGEESDKDVKPMKKSLMHVSPVDYVEREQSISPYIAKMDYEKVLPVSPGTSLLSISSLLTRRSAREFIRRPLSDNDTRFFLDSLRDLPDVLEPYIVLLRSEHLSEGLYKNDICLKQANYEKRMSALMVEQHFLSNASMVIVLTAKSFSPTTLMQSGAEVHKLHLHAQERGIGCTGVGAFYDLNVQKFLNTQNSILYVCAIGAVA